ncbi:ABC transporter permease subunit [Cupriavidus taiwanensis]|uniref:High-affinity branched-chain amino acid transport protein, ABC superfamily, membrane component n=2 Tax=Cupriavidus taiwanensis TaxID=164546 RepID=A0A375DDN6_9BURK|nr:ABC transporter ATP-binding protein [Cupriavidus taiwanensis]CAQ70434.1 high-affinity branched-chain amino acid transport protein, ABC superfamily, membrane component [Cupriavidus taiwanensis LMG 19424]SOY49593.1 high-affinity branched-chain amino acid transport protein, ABC superfamily, membrane component [Cupriavidus taiwanensis]SOY88992.1 high-affinity branched-chain amino acid transport protein, ABC superfamily, membrane component [Cupriavidus taiwanensis]SOZ03081.1 high-affinity branche
MNTPIPSTAAVAAPTKVPAKTLAALIGFLVVALCAPFIVQTLGGNYWVRVLDFALLYIMLALGLNIVVGFAGLLDLGYIAFYAVGAYMMALLGSPHLANQFEWIQQLFPTGIHLSMWFVLPLAILVAATFGVLLGAPTLKLRGDYLAIVTLGFGEIIRIFMNNLDRPVNITNGPKGITAVDPVHIFGFDFSKSHEIFGLKFSPVFMYYYLLVFLVIVIVFVCLRLQTSRIGRAWVAIREDEIAAKAMGINTRNIKLLAFAMGASFGGASGAVFGAFQGFVSPESFTLWESIYVLAIVVLGGMGHIPGVILGGVLLVGFQELLRVVAEPMQTGLFGHVIVDAEVLRQLLFGLALVGVMLYRPAGIWPSPRKEDRPVVRRAGNIGRL